MTMRKWSLDRVMNLFESIAIGALIFVAFVIGVMQVVLRYVFNTGFPWTEGIFITLTVWALLLSGGRAVRDGLHIRVDVFVMNLPAGMRRPIHFFANLVSLGLCVFYIYCGFLYTHFIWQINVISTDAYIPEWIIYAIIPLSMTVFMIRYLQVIWWSISGRGAEQADGH
jgi:TRAP-type C4-dicarboxylate transport system permease small subunit